MRPGGRLIRIVALVLVLGMTAMASGSPAGAQATERDQARAAVDAKESNVVSQGISLGSRLNDVDPVPGGWQRRYQFGHIYWSSPVGAHVVYGAILGKYLDSGGTRVLGLPTTDEVAVTGGRKNEFQGGHIYWSASTGSRLVYGAILGRYLAIGASGSILGLPISDELGVRGGRVSHFQRGHIYWSPGSGGFEVYGAILGRYLGLGGPGGFLGFPVSGELAVTGGRNSEFQGGHIYWSPSTDSRLVYGAILGRYLAIGASGSPLGLPTSDELGVPGGRVSHFQRGHIYWSPGSGGFEVYGAILGRYLGLGGPGGFLGFPVSGELAVTGGRNSEFQGGHIYWSPSTDSRLVHGAILGRYLAVGGAQSPLGLPVTDEYGVPEGRRNDFQGGYVVWRAASNETSVVYGRAPNLNVEQQAGGLDIPWDLGFIPDGTMIFTERGGRICVLANGGCRSVATVTDAYVNGEGGVLGMAVDPDFASNRSFWVCQTLKSGTSPVDVRVYRWSLNATATAATRDANPVVFGLPISSGRHSGCRPRFGPDGNLWIGTGDAAQGPWPQNLDFPNDRRSQGGKILRVDEDTGLGVAGNVRGVIYSYGHRNVQGLAFRPGSGQAFSAEHGPDRDDEINRLQPGDHGWNPVSPSGGLAYNESVPMTRPGAIPAIWSSGSSTLATSGSAFVSGAPWRQWDGALVVACLKATQLLVLNLDGAGNVISQVTRELPGYEAFRLRSAVQGPDGSLYVTTSNGGGNDRILRVTPS